MKDLIRLLLPQWVINHFYHLPLAFLANLFYGFPSKELTVIGVTGTDGKTTTTNMIYQILKAAGKKVSMVSTINAVVGEKQMDTGFHVTSPDPFLVQKLLRKAVDAETEYMVLEVTSHALDQFRFWGVNFNIGVITNITHEHLDYHRTWENYFQAKAKLIRAVKVAVLNKDEKHFERLSGLTTGKVVSFGLSGPADFNPKKFPLGLNIPGEYNLLNGLATAAVCNELGVDKKLIKQILANFQGLPGRMEQVGNKRGIKIVIDFAHTPNGLEQALKTLRTQAPKRPLARLIAIIGAEGYRDKMKRSIMGEIAAKLADIVVITAVDPRGQLKEINHQIMVGAKKAGGKLGENVHIIDDRRNAINFAINDLAKAGDVVGIFGKGHEQSMNLDGKHEIPWSDLEAVEKALGYQNG